MVFNTVWGVDIGNSAIKAVKMTKAGAVCKVADFDIVDIPYAEDDKDRTARVEAALTELVKNHRFGGDPVCIALTGNICLSREFQLPPGSEEKLHELIQYEAKQQIPFPLDQVEWGFERYEDPAGIGVVLIAVRKNDIQELLAMTDKFKMNVCGITTSSMALFNYVHFEFDPQNTTLILDAGARGTDFVVMNKRQIYSRSIQIAGREITRVLENKFKVPYQKAEELKKNISQSPQMEKILSVIEPTLRQLGAEVQRTIGFYKSKARGQRIAQCYLLGHTFRLPKMAEYLQTQVREAPFAIVEGLQRIKLDPACNATVWDQEFPTMAVAIGLGLQGVGCGELTLNLLPSERQAAQRGSSWKVWAVASAAVILATVGICYFQATGILEDFQKKEADLKTTLADVNKWEDQEKRVAEPLAARQQALDRLGRSARDRGRLAALYGRVLALRSDDNRPFFGPASRTFLSDIYASRRPFPVDNGRGKDLSNNALLTGPNSLYATWAGQFDLAQNLPPELRPDVPLVVVLTIEVDTSVSEPQFMKELKQTLWKIDEIKSAVKDPNDIAVERGSSEATPSEATLLYDWDGKLETDPRAAQPPQSARFNTFHAIFRWQDVNDRDIDTVAAAKAPVAPAKKH